MVLSACDANTGYIYVPMSVPNGTESVFPTSSQIGVPLPRPWTTNQRSVTADSGLDNAAPFRAYLIVSLHTFASMPVVEAQFLKLNG